jgi:TetR/AcrR family transcriptional regulator, repressor of fatR-cypB operon
MLPFIGERDFLVTYSWKRNLIHSLTRFEYRCSFVIDFTMSISYNKYNGMNIHSGFDLEVRKITTTKPVITGKADLILDAALVLFAEHGIDATTVPAIAGKAGVGAGTIYRYFENKEALVNALFQSCVLRLYETVKREYPFEGTTYAQFRHLFYGIIQFTKGNEDQLYFIEMNNNSRYLDPASQTAFKQLMDFFHGFFDMGIAQGAIRLMPSIALIAIVYGAIVRLYKLIRTGQISLTPALLAGFESACWDAIRNHGTKAE